MRIPEDMGEAIELMARLRRVLQIVLDQVDYTAGACSVTEMIGACLPKEVLEQAHQLLEETSDRKDSSTAGN